MQTIRTAIGRTVSRVKSRQSGQGMTEYIIIVALIAIAAIGVYSYFGKTVRNQTAGMAKELSGQSASTEIGNAQSSASAASTDANKNKAMGKYNNDAVDQ
jgi:Flp pilus assembly pilin Flp